MKTVAGLILAAAAAFFVLFSPWTKPHIPFFWLMTLTGFLLATAAVALQRKNLHELYLFKAVDILIGIVSATVLYAVFWIGHTLSIRILPFAAPQIDAIYTIRAGQNAWLIAGLLFFVIGPAEEIFWRGLVQQRLSKRYGVLIGLIGATAIYVLVHLWSFNLMLLAASAVCGGFWGLLFVATGRLWPAIISHALWDAAIFIIWPIK